MRGQGDDGMRWSLRFLLPLAQAACGLEAVHEGHFAIHENDIEFFFSVFDDVQRFLAAAGQSGIYAHLLQEAVYHQLIDGVVFHYQGLSAGKE